MMNKINIKKTLVLLSFAFVFLFGACKNAADNDQEKILVTSISIKQTVSVVSGETYQFEAKVLPENATDKSVEFSVGSLDYATVLDAKTGKIKFKNTGNEAKKVVVICKAQDGSKKKAESKVTVELAPPSVFNYTGFDFITAGPSYNSSTGMVISWHSEVAENILEYTEPDGDAFTKTINVTGKKTECDWADKASYYRCRVELTNLKPASTYKYRVRKAGTSAESSDTDTGNLSKTRSLVTAGSDTSFNFAVLSDLHTPKGSKKYIKNISDLLDFSLQNIQKDDTLVNKTLPLCIFNGDMVNKGQIYQQWNYWGQEPSLENTVYAFVEGNHDYYPYKSKDRVSDSWYLDCAAIPNPKDSAFDQAIKTNLEPTNYYFIYNKVLFICLDTMMMEASRMSGEYETSLDAQMNWFKEVINANLGKYTYIVVAKHYTFINGDTVSDYGNYKKWYKLFDECMVDFAIGSDEHTYSRTKPLYDDKVQSDSSSDQTTGTIYLTTPQTEGDLDPIYDRGTGGRSAFDGTEGGCGGLYFNVSDEKMTMHLISGDGIECDKCTVYKRDRSGFTGFKNEKAE